MPATHTDHKINKYFFLAIILLFGVFLFFSLVQFFSAFLGAVMLYVLSKGFMGRLIKRGWRKSWAAVAVIVISFFIILVPIGALSIMLYDKAKLFLAQPDIIEKTLGHFETTINERYGIEIFSQKNIENIQSYATTAITFILNQGLNLVATISMMYFFVYFMLININRMEAAIIFFLPFKRNKIELFGKELVSQTIANSVVVPMIALAQGLFAFIAYLITGLPQAGFWAIVTGLSSVIPIVGTGLIWFPASIYMFVTGHTWQGVFIFIWGGAVLSTVDNVIRFLMAKRMADTHPIVTVLGVIVGLKYFGLPGLIFGPLLISYFVILLKIYYLEYQSDLPMMRRNKNIPIRFNLPFLGTKPKAVKKK